MPTTAPAAPTAPAIDPTAPDVQDDRYDPALPMATPVVLVVEDDDDSRDLIGAVLEHHGIDALGAATVAEAMAHLRARPVSAILLDMRLPDGFGHDVCRAVRNDPDLARTPVIMLTADGTLDGELTGIMAGADAYLVKPVSPQALITRLQDVL